MKIDIEDFVRGHVENNNYTAISQTMTNRKYGAVFAVLDNLTPRPQYKIKVVKTDSLVCSNFIFWLLATYLMGKATELIQIQKFCFFEHP